METSQAAQSRTLVVMLHAMGWRREKAFREAIQVTRSVLPGVQIWAPRLPTQWWSNASPSDLVKRVLVYIDEQDRQKSFDRIVLVGYSIGGILARAAFVEAWETRRPWALRVERLILLAAMNRGWSFAPTVNVFVDLIRQSFYYALRALGLTRLFASVRCGSSFVTDLRLRWLNLEPVVRETTVVQLLGTVDDVVSPDDNIDIHSGHGFIYLDVPGSGHLNVLQFSDKIHGAKRRDRYLTALTRSQEELKKIASPVALAFEPDESITDVLFVVHGIRDYGFWTAHLARFIAGVAKKQGLRMAYITPKYGYFGLLPFLLPWNRREKVRWFMDQYVEARARYPKAKRISYVGHSNGTYLLSRALRDYSTPHFDRVVFAGSVVRTDYRWEDYIPTRVARVLNYVATADWVVAIFPGFLGRFKIGRALFDLGGAGFDGFTKVKLDPHAPLNDVEYIVGTHSAALREFNWDYIANFVVCDMVDKKNPQTQGPPSLLVRILAAGASVIWLVLLLIVFLPLVILAVDPLIEGFDIGLWQWLLFTLLWILLMRTILVRA